MSNYNNRLLKYAELKLQHLQSVSAKMKLKIPSSWGNFDAETLSKRKQLRAIKRKTKKLATPMLL